MNENGLRLCRFRNLTVRTNNAPEGFYGRFLTESAICGHPDESGMCWNHGGGDDHFPILDEDWGIHGEMDSHANDYLEMAKMP